MGNENKRLRIASRQRQSVATVDSGDIWQSHAKREWKAREGRKKGRQQGERKRQGRQMLGVDLGKGKKKGLQSMSEWDQTDEYTSVPILSMSCGENR